MVDPDGGSLPPRLKRRPLRRPPPVPPPFTDAHVHFWEPRRLPYPWLDAVPAIAGAHTPGELRAEAGVDQPEKIVCVQAECARDRWADEVAWVGELAAAEPRLAAIVAHAPIDAGARTTAALATLARVPLVRGARHLIQDEPDPGFCTRAAFVAGVRQLGAAGLTFDLCCRAAQLPAVAQLVRACPDTTFILDHAGKPDLRSGHLAAWRDHIAQLAALPNVACKFSGLLTEADPAADGAAVLGPVAAHLLATFGPGRLLFGSDWPVLKLATTYGRWLALARELWSALPAADQTAIFATNAARLYRLA